MNRQPLLGPSQSGPSGFTIFLSLPCNHLAPSGVYSTEPMVHEIKFLVPLDKAQPIIDWARARTDADPHGAGPHRDEYLVQSVYFDTPKWQVFHKHGSYGRAKYRVRRYNDLDWVFLERKMKREGLVRKRRSTLPIGDLPALDSREAAAWYRNRLSLRQLIPTCYIQYERVARLKQTNEGLLRLTVDRALKFKTDVSWQWPGRGGSDFLADLAILELKYATLPTLAKNLIEEFALTPAPASKYRFAMKSSHLAAQIEAAGPAIPIEPEAASLKVA